jgi:hypothetical protein
MRSCFRAQTVTNGWLIHEERDLYTDADLVPVTPPRVG